MTGKLQRSGLLNRRRFAATSTFICGFCMIIISNWILMSISSWILKTMFTQALGLAKASKLQGRNTSQVHPLLLFTYHKSKISLIFWRENIQGLLGLRVKGGTAALVELNCETDFVARNQKFLALLEEVRCSPQFGWHLHFLLKVADACLKVDGGDGGSTISGEQVGALADGEGRLVNGPHWIQRRSGLSTTFKSLKFASLVLLCFVQGVSQTSWP